MKNKLILTAFAVAIMAAPVAFAGDHEGKGEDRHAKMMEKVDTDKDGKLSKTEYMAMHEARFAENDTDADGFLSGDEMKAAWKKMREEKKEKMEDKADGAASAPATEEAAPADAAPVEGAAD